MTRIALLAAAAALAVCACGDDPAPVAKEDPAPEVALHPVIGAPLAGTTITADSREGTTLVTEVEVTGQAEPDTRVVVSSGCTSDACMGKVRTTGDGSFETTVRLTTDVARPRGTIVLGYENGAPSYDTDRVVVTVAPPAVARSRDEPRKRARAASARDLVVIGDSLAVGMEPYLAEFLSGWNVSVDARIGRPLAEGMQVFNGSPKPSRPTVYALGLFTNDFPESVGALEAAVRQTTSRGSCVVWATIVAPPVGGQSYDAANAKLRSLAASSGGRIRLVEWAGLVARNQSWIMEDGVHATPTGYRNRAALYAAAAKGCAG